MAKSRQATTFGEIDDRLAITARKILAKELKCHDCGAREGEFHKPGCDMEVCPFCHGQLISCNCPYKKLGVGERDLTKEENRRWDAILRKKGLIPYAPTIDVCVRCGQREPKMFAVPDRDWQKYVPPEYWKEVLCRPCYDHYKRLFPRGWRKGRRVSRTGRPRPKGHWEPLAQAIIKSVKKKQSC